MYTIYIYLYIRFFVAPSPTNLSNKKQTTTIQTLREQSLDMQIYKFFFIVYTELLLLFLLYNC